MKGAGEADAGLADDATDVANGAADWRGIERFADAESDVAYHKDPRLPAPDVDRGNDGIALAVGADHIRRGAVQLPELIETHDSGGRITTGRSVA